MTTLYTGIEKVKRFARILDITDLGFSTTDAYEDHIEELIEKASRFIDNYCKRPSEFFKGGATVTEKHDGKETRSSDYSDYPSHTISRSRDRRRKFFLRQYPIISITSVKENDASIGEADDWTTITSPDYRVDMDSGILMFALDKIPDDGFQNVEFVYKAGYSVADQPPETNGVCAQLVANWLIAGLQQRSRQYIHMPRPTPMEFESPEVFTEDMERQLQPFVKRR